jgi:hypothetical protein
MSNSNVVEWASKNNASLSGTSISGNFKSGRALGLMQWDGETAQALVQGAIDKGVNWYNLNYQLEYLISYMNISYIHSTVEEFNEHANSVEQAAYWFAHMDERCGLTTTLSGGRTCASEVSYDEREYITGWEKRCGVAILAYEEFLQ